MIEPIDFETSFLPYHVIIPLIQQLLTAINICHSRGIVHRNIKPKHILIHPGPDPENQLKNATLKLSDFTLGKSIGMIERQSTMDVVTLWYRSPEMLLGRANYHGEIDIWSVGCIFAELIGGKALFPGKSSWMMTPPRGTLGPTSLPQRATPNAQPPAAGV